MASPEVTTDVRTTAPSDASGRIQSQRAEAVTATATISAAAKCVTANDASRSDEQAGRRGSDPRAD